MPQKIWVRIATVPGEIQMGFAHHNTSVTAWASLLFIVSDAGTVIPALVTVSALIDALVTVRALIDASTQPYDVAFQ